jgi:hypothetical protein
MEGTKNLKESICKVITQCYFYDLSSRIFAFCRRYVLTT